MGFNRFATRVKEAKENTAIKWKGFRRKSRDRVVTCFDRIKNSRCCNCPRKTKVREANLELSDDEKKKQAKPKPNSLVKERRRKRIEAFKASWKKRFLACFAGVKFFWNSIKATFSRVLYIVHALLTIWQVTVVLGKWYWAIAGWLVTIVLEIGVVIFKYSGVEWKWFQPSIFLYLVAEIPSIWLLELERTSQVQIHHNETFIVLGDLLAEKGNQNLKAPLFGLRLSHAYWTLLLEQSMMVLIIIARWLMPKGNMTRDQLSGLLLYYLGTASDLVDFFSVLAEDDTFLLNTVFVYTVLATWSWSMFQFVFVVTMTTDDGEGEETSPEDGEDKSKMAAKDGSDDDECDDEDENRPTCWSRFKKKLGAVLESEAWCISLSMVMQDGPFAVVRCLCLFYWGIRTYTNYFFTFKNVLIVCLQSYRLLSVYEDYKKKKLEDEMRERLHRKTHQVGVTLAAVSAFKKGGQKQKAMRDESDLETDHLESARMEEPLSDFEIPKVKIQPNFAFLTNEKPVSALQLKPTTGRALDDVSERNTIQENSSEEDSSTDDDGISGRQTEMSPLDTDSEEEIIPAPKKTPSPTKQIKETKAKETHKNTPSPKKESREIVAPPKPKSPYSRNKSKLKIKPVISSESEEESEDSYARIRKAESKQAKQAVKPGKPPKRNSKSKLISSESAEESKTESEDSEPRKRSRSKQQKQIQKRVSFEQTKSRKSNKKPKSETEEESTESEPPARRPKSKEQKRSKSRSKSRSKRNETESESENSDDSDDSHKYSKHRRDKKLSKHRNAGRRKNNRTRVSDSESDDSDSEIEYQRQNRSKSREKQRRSNSKRSSSSRRKRRDVAIEIESDSESV